MAAFVAVGCALGAMIYSFDHISGELPSQWMLRLRSAFSLL